MHTYTHPGVYTVRLRVYNSGGRDGEVRRDWITAVSPFPTRMAFPHTVVPFAVPRALWR